MLKRLHKLWRLSRKRTEDLEKLLTAPEQVLNQLPDETPDVEGAFFPLATSEDAKRQQQEDDGTAAWLDRISKL